MNSIEEDALFSQWGWTKDLIARRYVSPGGIAFDFDEVVALTSTPQGEERLREAVELLGVQPGAQA